jgi:hypothetical protein
MRAIFPLFILLALPFSAFSEDSFPKFKAQTIDPNIGKVCYAVTLADVDGDSNQDIVAVSENRVLWYHNPTWKPHVIIQDETPPDNVCIAALDIDRDGNVDFALGAGWTKIGTIHWLHRGASLDDPWQMRSVGEEQGLHRMRWADVLGTGRLQLVISPLNATVGDGVRLTAFEIPEDPFTDRWLPTVLNGELNQMHNHWHVDFDGNGTMKTLTASREGVHLIQRTSAGWSRTKLGTGATATWRRKTWSSPT